MTASECTGAVGGWCCGVGSCGRRWKVEMVAGMAEGAGWAPAERRWGDGVTWRLSTIGEESGGVDGEGITSQRYERACMQTGGTSGRFFY